VNLPKRADNHTPGKPEPLWRR